jgi:LPXTG-site transpeptidase (sortase) family protein
MNDDARPSRVNASGRALLVVAVVALAAAATFALMAVRGGATPEATLVVEPAVAAEPPTTIAPLAASEPAPAEAPIAPVDPAAGDEPSSLAALVGPRGSAVPKAYTRLVPASVTIDDISLWGPIRSVALEDDGEMEVPDETEVGWYELGAAPGEAGATVLAAHVTWNDTVGPFHKLGELEPGAEIRMRLSDGSTRIYEVVERTMFRKDELPNWRIFRRDGPESLVLITCGGSFNENVRRYRDNIVVFAVPVGAEPAPAA